MNRLEIKLYNFIKELHQEIKEMYPKGGLSSPRDMELAKEISKKGAIFDRLQEAMRVINPEFDIRDS